MSKSFVLVVTSACKIEVVPFYQFNREYFGQYSRDKGAPKLIGNVIYCKNMRVTVVYFFFFQWSSLIKYVYYLKVSDSSWTKYSSLFANVFGIKKTTQLAAFF